MSGRDEITLHCNGVVLRRWLRYTITHQLYAADSSFSFVMARSDVAVQAGDECSLRINNLPAMTGIVDTVRTTYDAGSGVTTTITGRDIMGLVVDQHVTRWVTFAGRTLKYLAEKLLPDVPLVGKKRVEFRDGTEKLNTIGDLVQPEPGQTVFDVLKAAAIARGALFYAAPDGTFVFGKPLQTGEAAYDFSVVKTAGKTVNRSNIISGATERISTQHYRTVIVTGEEEEETFKRTFTDETAPIDKTLVVVRNNSTALGAYGANLVAQQRFRSRSVQYTVSGHSQNGAVFQVNRMSTVKDDVLGVAGTYLVYGVVFTLDKERGTLTEVRLGLPGAAA